MSNVADKIIKKIKDNVSTKEYILLNHENGDFDIGYDEHYILSCLEIELASGADLENFSLYYGDKKQIVEEKVVSNEYKIRD